MVYVLCLNGVEEGTEIEAKGTYHAYRYEQHIVYACRVLPLQFMQEGFRKLYLPNMYALTGLSKACQ